MPVEISPASVWWSVPPVAVTDLPCRPSSARKASSVAFAVASTASSPASKSIASGAPTCRGSCRRRRGPSRSAGCRGPGGGRQPSRWTRSSIAFSSSMLAGLQRRRVERDELTPVLHHRHSHTGGATSTGCRRPKLPRCPRPARSPSPSVPSGARSRSSSRRGPGGGALVVRLGRQTVLRPVRRLADRAARKALEARDARRSLLDHEGRRLDGHPPPRRPRRPRLRRAGRHVLAGVRGGRQGARHRARPAHAPRRPLQRPRGAPSARRTCSTTSRWRSASRPARSHAPTALRLPRDHLRLAARRPRPPRDRHGHRGARPHRDRGAARRRRAAHRRARDARELVAEPVGSALRHAGRGRALLTPL